MAAARACACAYACLWERAALSLGCVVRRSRIGAHAASPLTSNVASMMTSGRVLPGGVKKLGENSRVETLIGAPLSSASALVARAPKAPNHPSPTMAPHHRAARVSGRPVRVEAAERRLPVQPGGPVAIATSGEEPPMIVYRERGGLSSPDWQTKRLAGTSKWAWEEVPEGSDECKCHFVTDHLIFKRQNLAAPKTSCGPPNAPRHAHGHTKASAKHTNLNLMLSLSRVI